MEGQRSDIRCCDLKNIFFLYGTMKQYFCLQPAIEGHFERTMGGPLLLRSISKVSINQYYYQVEALHET